MSSAIMLPKECRAVRTANSVRPVAVRAQNMTSVASIRGNALIASKTLETRAQRMANVVLAAYNPDSGKDGYGQDSLQERVVQVRRVTKVVKGGKQLSFRAVVVVGNENGSVGVGCDSAKEVLQAVRKAATNARRNMVTIPLTKNASFPHRFDGIFGSAKVMLRPAAEGTGVIAGGAVRVVLELAGVKNGFGKQLGSANPLNNAKATVEGLKSMRTFEQVAAERGIPVENLLPIKS